MRKTTVAIAAGLCLLPAFSSAQNVSKEAGAYERKSVTYVNALWLMDESVRGLHPHQVAFVLDKVKQAISMPRFDYNPIPDSLLRDFAAQANAVRYPYVNEAIATAGGADPMLDSIAAVIGAYRGRAGTRNCGSQQGDARGESHQRTAAQFLYRRQGQNHGHHHGRHRESDEFRVHLSTADPRIFLAAQRQFVFGGVCGGNRLVQDS